jgi:hypothetical protein
MPDWRDTYISRENMDYIYPKEDFKKEPKKEPPKKKLEFFEDRRSPDTHVVDKGIF